MIKATIDHGNVKYAVSDNGYILALDNDEHELFKYPISLIHLTTGSNDRSKTYYSAIIVFPDHNEVHFQESDKLTPFVEALIKYRSKVQ